MQDSADTCHQAMLGRWAFEEVIVMSIPPQVGAFSHLEWQPLSLG